MKNKIHSLYLLHNMKYGKRGWRREVCSIYYLCTQKDQSLKITKILTFSRSGCQTNFSFGYILLGEQIMPLICLFGVLRRFQHCTGHITTGSWKGRGNQYIEFARVVYCKLPTNGKLLPAFPLTAMTGIEPRPQRWEARVLPLCTVAPDHAFEHKYL